MSTLEVLENARAQIADPAFWIREWRGKYGETCALGAVRKAKGLNPWPVTGTEITLWPFSQIEAQASECQAAGEALAAVIGAENVQDVIGYNDSHSHACVIAMYDAAIEREKQKAAE
jgi:membrane-bound lytic murein transglycosylase B